jgi:hypothetical protein
LGSASGVLKQELTTRTPASKSSRSRPQRSRSTFSRVTTSARRFRQRGPLRQQWLNTRLLLRFLAGAPLEKLARLYRA